MDNGEDLLIVKEIDFKKLSKQDLIYKILDAQAVNAPPTQTKEILVEDDSAYGKLPSVASQKRDDNTAKRPRKRLDDKPELPRPKPLATRPNAAARAPRITPP